MLISSERNKYIVVYRASYQSAKNIKINKAMAAYKKHTKKVLSRNPPPHSAKGSRPGTTKRGTKKSVGDPFDGPGYVYVLKHPTRRGLYTIGRAIHRAGERRKHVPVSKTKAIKPSGEGDRITRKSSFDKVYVTFKPSYRKPRGDTEWIFWVINDKDFRIPHHGHGSGLVSGKRAKQYVADGFKVYVVKALPDAWA